MRGSLLLSAVLIGACAPDVASSDDDDATDGPACVATGEPTLEIVSDDAEHHPIADGGALIVERRYQGAIATVVGLRFRGAAEGESLGPLTAEVVNEAGDVLAGRFFDDTLGPCDEHGGVGYHGFEVFYAYGGPMPEVDGVEATLRVTVGDRVDAVRGTLQIP